MKEASRRIAVLGTLTVAVIAVLVTGSALYWVGEGKPRTPAAFRDLVDASGLVVDWSSNGPRGGDGVVVSDCGDQVVSVTELDGELWVAWDDTRAPITSAVIERIVRCAQWANDVAVDADTEVVPSISTDPADPTELNAMLLHLPDAPKGALIGDDSSCGYGVGGDGDSGPFLDLVIEAQGAIVGCFNQLEAPEVFIDSLVLSFPNENLAARALAADTFAGVISYFALDDPNAEPLGPLVAAVVADSTAIEAVSPADRLAVIAWRFDSVIWLPRSAQPRPALLRTSRS